MKPAVRKMLDDVSPAVDRRSFFRTLSLGTAGALALSGEAAAGAAAEFVQANVKRASEPSALKITDLRVAVVVGAPMTCPLIRVDTNQGLVGWGEVRDGASELYALMLKSRVLGENPCNVDRIFRKIKQFGHHARQAGGVCGIDMAMMDLAGKAWGVPCWQLLGGKFRDRVRLYADTTSRADPTQAAPPERGPRHHLLEADFDRVDARRATRSRADQHQHQPGRSRMRRSPASGSPTRHRLAVRLGRPVLG
jgi:hypothetical protein